MDLEAAKLINGRICRYAMLAAFGCLLLTAAILIGASLQPSAHDDVAAISTTGLSHTPNPGQL